MLHHHGAPAGDSSDIASSSLPSKTNDSRILWTPSESYVASSNLTRFVQYLHKTVPTLSALSPTDYSTLHKWSVEHLEDFWASLWKFLDIIHSKPYDNVLVNNTNRMQDSKFFTGAKLNFAENLLRYKNSSHDAIIWKGEDPMSLRRVSYTELYNDVRKWAHELRLDGLKPGDRVAAYMPNTPETVSLMLATTAIGGTWSSCSPDFGEKAVLDRFVQIEPKILFATDGYYYKGKWISTLEKIQNIASQLPEKLTRVIIIRYDNNNSNTEISSLLTDDKFVLDKEFLKTSNIPAEIEFEQLPFDHPVYIMYSSGTTGLPKCIVQGSGVLLNHLKEHSLHMNIKALDKVFYFTTCGWMMWNWLVSALGLGATIVLFDGNPLFPNASSLWSLASDVGITVFGTSARYLTAVSSSSSSSKDVIKSLDLSALRTIASTGSPATDAIFKFVYNDLKPDVQFASISGGTDLNGCFALGCSNLPVRSGELQCRGLGLDVAVFNDSGEEVIGEKGELVCKQPFPSMPLCFYNDTKDGAKYKDAYFNVFPNVWRHGDFAEITIPAEGVIIHGRSDATLNPGGVRIGTSDIYQAIESTEELTTFISDTIVIGKDYVLPDGNPDVEIVLFYTKIAHDDDLHQKIKSVIRKKLSPRHVPAIVVECPDIPYTFSGKKVEISIKRIFQGQAVKNASSLRNPESLEWFKEYYYNNKSL